MSLLYSLLLLQMTEYAVVEFTDEQAVQVLLKSWLELTKVSKHKTTS